MKHMPANRALMGGILKILSLFEILPVYLVDKLYLSVADGQKILHIWSGSGGVGT